MDPGGLMICVSIAPRGKVEAERQLLEAEGVGDMVELRLDLMEDAIVHYLLKRHKKPLLLTFRSKAQGGVGTWADGYLSLMTRALEDRGLYVDVEYQALGTVMGVLRPIWAERVVLSLHLLEDTPDIEVLKGLYLRMASWGPWSIKLVTYAKEVKDNLTIKRFLGWAAKRTPRLISFSMGDLGLMSRVMCLRWGGFMTYCCLEGRSLAEGQVSGELLVELMDGQGG